MNENNELLLHLAKNAEMGVSSTTKLLNTLKNKENKIKPLLENELKEYEYFKKKTEKLLKKNKVDVPSTNIFAKISSDLGIKMETGSLFLKYRFILLFLAKSLLPDTCRFGNEGRQRLLRGEAIAESCRKCPWHLQDSRCASGLSH